MDIKFSSSISLASILQFLCAVATIIVTFIINKRTIKNNKEDLLIQIEEMKKQHNQNRDFDHKKNQIDCLPIISLKEIKAIPNNDDKLSFNLTFNNIGNGAALHCSLIKNDLIVYKDKNDSELNYIQSDHNAPLLNVGNSFTTKITSNQQFDGKEKEVQLNLCYEDLMGRKYKQLFVFYYGYPGMLDVHVTNTYLWECIKDI